MPYNSVVSCCVVFPASQPNGQCLSRLDHTLHRGECSEKMKSSCKSWPVTLPQKHSVQRKPQFLLSTAESQWGYKFSSITSQYRHLWATSRSFHSFQVKDRAMASKLAPSWGGSLSAAAAIGLWPEQGWKLWKWKCYSLRCVQLFSTPRTVAHQAPLSMVFSRQEYWNWLPFHSLVDHILSALFIMTHPSWVTLYNMDDGFTELWKPIHQYKAVIHSSTKLFWLL